METIYKKLTPLLFDHVSKISTINTQPVEQREIWNAHPYTLQVWECDENGYEISECVEYGTLTEMKEAESLNTKVFWDAFNNAFDEWKNHYSANNNDPVPIIYIMLNRNGKNYKKTRIGIRFWGFIFEAELMKMVENDDYTPKTLFEIFFMLNDYFPIRKDYKNYKYAVLFSIINELSKGICKIL